MFGLDKLKWKLNIKTVSMCCASLPDTRYPGSGLEFLCFESNFNGSLACHAIYFEASLWPTPVTWSLPRFLIAWGTRGQNWVNPHNLICVDVHHFDPLCTLNWAHGQHRSHDHFAGLSLVKAPWVNIECSHATVFVWMYSIWTPFER